MEKLSIFGAGPKIARIMLPWLAVTIVLTILVKGPFVLTTSFIYGVHLAGYIILGTGLTLYIVTLRGLLKGLKETRLQTTGGFYLCQNPLYASIMLMIIPGIALILNSWLILTTSVVGYLMFRIHIGSEYSQLERIFGEAYLKYKKDTPVFFPFPVKKLLRKVQ